MMLRLIPLKLWVALAVLTAGGVFVMQQRYDAVQAERARQAEITEQRERKIFNAINNADDCADWRKCLRAR
tara:strand:- start:313 stop:525 length:213 start_codon:yes stop_codon:yes gene_type:complete